MKRKEPGRRDGIVGFQVGSEYHSPLLAVEVSPVAQAQSASNRRRMILDRRNCCFCVGSLRFWISGTGNNPDKEVSNIDMKTPAFVGKCLPCPVCNAALRLKMSQKEKPYCMCLDCGIQIFFRGQAGIARLRKMIAWQEAVAGWIQRSGWAVSLYNRLQELKRQKSVT